MQAINPTPQLIKDFANDYVIIPCVRFEGANPHNIPLNFLPLIVWLNELHRGDISMYMRFTVWLAGRGTFLDPQEGVDDMLLNALVDAIGPKFMLEMFPNVKTKEI